MTNHVRTCSLVFVLCLLLFTACGKQTGQEENTNTPTPSAAAGNEAATPTVTAAPLSMEEQMVVDSLMATGNNYRIKQVMEKARAGEEVTVGYIGGSITEGYNAGTKDIYAKLSYEYFADTYGTGENVHYVNAGLSGTPSILGLIRSDRDLFAEQPDLIFIEFAVNDGTTQVDNTGLESLIYKCLTQPNEPAVVLLFSVTETGYTCQDNMGAIGFAYDLPRISVKNAIWPYIESGEYTWADWSNDGSHPNAAGCRLYADFIIHYFETVDAEEADASYELPGRFIKGFDHSGLVMVDRSMNMDRVTITSLGSFEETGDLASFNEGWTKTGEGNDPFVFSFEGSALYLVYKDTSGSSYGTAEVYIDGEYVMSLYGSSDDGWNNPDTVRVLRENESAEHTVEIRMAEGEEAKRFGLLCLGVY